MSFGREHRIEQCGRQSPWVYQARLAEIDYALAQLRKLPWIDNNNLILFGHSEGGVAASRYTGLAFDGVVITSAGCWKYALRLPALAVVSAGDERLLGGTCEQADQQMVLPGERHQVLADRSARERNRQFIHERTGRDG